MDRHYYEMSVLWELRNALRSGEVWLEKSRRYQDPESYLIPGSQWPGIKIEAEQLLKLPPINRDRIKDRCEELLSCYETLNQVLPTDKSVRIENGNVVVSPTEAEDEPPSVTRFKMVHQLVLRDHLCEPNPTIIGR